MGTFMGTQQPSGQRVSTSLAPGLLDGELPGLVMGDGVGDPQSYPQRIALAPASCTVLEIPEVFCSQVLWGI